MSNEIDQNFVNALFEQVKRLKDENERLKEENKNLKKDNEILEDNLFYLYQDEGNGTIN